MAAPAVRVCPFCGSADTRPFEDGSGVCGSCGRAFRGGAPLGALLIGEAVDPRKAARRRGKIRFGMLGILGGLLGFLAIPTIFLIGAALNRQNPGDYVATVLNRASGAIVCGGTALLVIAATYAMWAGFHIWRGYPERAIHGVISGALLAIAAVLAGLGIPGIVGILGGVIALVGGLLVLRAPRETDERGQRTAS